VPDTDHLSRMRAHLVAAHHHDDFIKSLAEGTSYMPNSLDRLGTDKSKEELGEKWEEIMLQRKRQL